MKRFMVVLMVLVPMLAFGQIAGGVFHEPLSTGGMISTGTLTLTRPSNATTYAANEAVASSATASATFVFRMPTFKKAGWLTDLSLQADTANSANALFRFWILADTANLSRMADNAAFTLLGPDSNLVDYVGYVDLVLSTEGTGSTAAFGTANNINMAFYAPARELYGLLEVKAAYLPKSGGKFKLKYRIFN